MDKPNILLIDRDPASAHNTAKNLFQQGYLVKETATSSWHARQKVEQSPIDLIILNTASDSDVEDNSELIQYLIRKRINCSLILTNGEVGALYKKSPNKSHASTYNIIKSSNDSPQIVPEYAIQNPNNPLLNTENDHFFVKDHFRFEKVKYADILWMKAENSYVEICTNKKHYLLTSYTLGAMLQKISYSNIIRVHRSYAINLNKVDAIEGNMVIIHQQHIPIGKNYQHEVKQLFPIL